MDKTAYSVSFWEHPGEPNIEEMAGLHLSSESFKRYRVVVFRDLKTNNWGEEYFRGGHQMCNIQSYDREVYLCNINVDLLHISGEFQALVLSRPTIDLVIANTSGIKTPSPEDIEEWNKRNGF